MEKVSIYDSNKNFLSNVTQWDEDIYVYAAIDDYSSSKTYRVHYFNANSTKSYVVNCTYSSPYLSSKIPNILLSESLPICGYIYVEGSEEKKSQYSFRIPVRKKPRPPDKTDPSDDDYLKVDDLLADCKQQLAKAQQYINDIYSYSSEASSAASEAKECATRAKQSANDATSALDSIGNAVADSKQYASQASDAADKASASASSAATSAAEVMSAATETKQHATNVANSEASVLESEKGVKSLAEQVEQTATAVANDADEAKQNALDVAQKAEEVKTNAAESQQAKESAIASSTLSQSYAVGGTHTRDGEDQDNSKYYFQQSQETVTRVQEIIANFSKTNGAWMQQIVTQLPDKGLPNIFYLIENDNGAYDTYWWVVKADGTGKFDILNNASKLEVAGVEELLQYVFSE